MSKDWLRDAKATRDWLRDAKAKKVKDGRSPGEFYTSEEYQQNPHLDPDYYDAMAHVEAMLEVKDEQDRERGEGRR